MDDLEVLEPANYRARVHEEDGISDDEEHKAGDNDSDSDSDSDDEDEEIYGYKPPTYCAKVFLIIFNVVLPILWLGAGCYYCYEVAQLYYVDDDGLDEDYNRNDMEICYFMITAFITFCTIATISFFLWYCGDGKKLTMPRKGLELFASVSLVAWGTYLFFIVGGLSDDFQGSDLYYYALASYYFITFFAFYTICTIFDHFFPCCCRGDACCDFEMGRKRLKEERVVVQYVDEDGNMLHQEEVLVDEKKQAKVMKAKLQTQMTRQGADGGAGKGMHGGGNDDFSELTGDGGRSMDSRLGITVLKSDDDDSDDDDLCDDKIRKKKRSKDRKKGAKSDGKKKKRKHEKHRRRHKQRGKQEQWATFCYIPIFRLV